jgi:hypothetical protein
VSNKNLSQFVSPSILTRASPLTESCTRVSPLTESRTRVRLVMHVAHRVPTRVSPLTGSLTRVSPFNESRTRVRVVVPAVAIGESLYQIQPSGGCLVTSLVTQSGMGRSRRTIWFYS